VEAAESYRGRSNRKDRAIFNIALAAGANHFAHLADKAADEGETGGVAVGVLLRFGRDLSIESALKDAFPDLDDVRIRAVRRVIGQYLDRQLTIENFAAATVKDEIKAALSKENAKLGDAIEVVDLIACVLGRLKKDK